jgi:hypothetical protein
VISKLTRVSPAMGVALVALVLSLGGTSFAQGAATKLGKLVSGSKIKRASIPGNRLIKGGVTGDRIKSNSLTGKQINESTLGPVPSALTAKKVAVAERATNAQRATNADNALALGGTAAAGYLTFGTRTIPSGTTVTGAFGVGSNVTAGVTVTVVDSGTPPATATAATALTSDIRQVVQLPGPAPADLSDATVNFATAGASDADASCTGTATAPTAPAGKVCLYLTASHGAGTAVSGEAIPGLPGSRSGFVVHATNGTLGETGAFGTWAYTAP